MAKMKFVYSFDEGNASMKALLGGKGANLAEMTGLGLPVPYGFTITTEACEYFYTNNRKWPAELEKDFVTYLAKVEKKMGKKFGDPSDPLLFSVRSGAAVSMPGMMDTILNLGLNEKTLKGMIEKTGNARFCWDSYRRFIQMFGDVVLEIPKPEFEKLISQKKSAKKVRLDTDLTAKDLEDLVVEYKKLVKAKTKKAFPEDPKEQLRLAINAGITCVQLPIAASTISKA